MRSLLSCLVLRQTRFPSRWKKGKSGTSLQLISIGEYLNPNSLSQHPTKLTKEERINEVEDKKINNSETYEFF